VTLTREGVPVRVGWSARGVAQPEVVWVSPEVGVRRQSTNRLLVAADGGFALTDRGRRYLALLATTPEGAPSW
jgi:hypothetical protein